MREASISVGQPGDFLDYRHVDVFFVYAFLWTSERDLPGKIFTEGLREDTGSWVTPFIHERVIGGLGPASEEGSWIGAYQPTFVLERRCLELSGESLVGERESKQEAWLIAPMKPQANLPEKGEAPRWTLERGADYCCLPVCTSWTLRLFDTGVGTFTCRICPKGIDRLSDRADRFSLIHWILRLAPNVDHFPEAHLKALGARDGRASLPSTLLTTNSFLYYPNYGRFRLHGLARSCRDRHLAVVPIPGISARPKARNAVIKADEDGLAYVKTEAEREKAEEGSKRNTSFGDWRENQTPYVLVTGILTPESMREVVQGLSLRVCKELVSICGRLTVQNQSACSEFLHLSGDYLEAALGVSTTRPRLRNLCLDERVFFALTRRGAVALTASPADLPATFVIPSVLNLLEILRSRLLAGIVLNSRLSRLARELEDLDPAAQPITPEKYAAYRKLVVSNLDDPLRYLFDGGSVTDLALEAERVLLVREVWDNVGASFDMVDQLISAWQTVRFKARYG